MISFFDDEEDTFETWLALAGHTEENVLNLLLYHWLTAVGAQKVCLDRRRLGTPSELAFRVRYQIP